MDPTDATYIFVSAGLGMFLVTLWTGHLGYRFRRETLVATGLLIAGLALLGLSFVAWNGETAAGSMVVPPQRVIIQVICMALALGAGGTLAVVSAQTIIQEHSPIEIRGRVIATQFLFTNLIGLLPMLVVGGLADYIGITRAMLGLAMLVIGSAVLSFRVHTTRRGP